MAKVTQLPIEILYASIAIIGGFARYLNGYVEGHRFSWRLFMASGFVAGFSGYMFALTGETLHLPPPMPHIMAGVGGFFGEQTLKLVYEYINKKVK